MFSSVERMIAFRYLRSRRKEGFISIIAWFSFLGIALGVATLIVVMAVMNGFRSEITKKIKFQVMSVNRVTPLTKAFVIFSVLNIYPPALFAENAGACYPTARDCRSGCAHRPDRRAAFRRRRAGVAA